MMLKTISIDDGELDTCMCYLELRKRTLKSHDDDYQERAQV